MKDDVVWNWRCPGKKIAFSIAVIAAVSAAACLTFRPAVQAPGPEVEAFFTCGNVVPAGELYAPESTGEAFGPESESVFGFVRLKNVSRDTWLRWRWYAPDGRLVRDSGRVAVLTRGRYLETVTAFDRLDFAPDTEKRPMGTWTVVLFIEEDLAGQIVFSLALSLE